MAKVAVLVSGGIDSSVSLRLLKDQGHDIVAFYLKIWLEDELSYLGDCPWQEDLSYVQAICAQANVPLEVISLQKEYWAEVVSYTINEVKSGRTPNPDILCNQRVKFGAFFSKIDESFDYVATGHYAQVTKVGDQFVLKSAPDKVKDQTYFLSHLSQKQLARAMFPIGHLLKSEVRDLGMTYDLPNKTRKDSQGICFLGKLKFDEFIRHYLGDQTGDLIELETGKKVGTHKGFWYYTIGQRQGLGLAGGPWYVVSKNTQSNVVYISKNYYSEEKSRNELYIQACNWFIEPDLNKTYQIKMRHGAKFNTGTLLRLSVPSDSEQALQKGEQSSANDTYKVTLTNRDQGIAPGQFVVFYQEESDDGSTDNLCIGGGIIVDDPTKK